METDAGRHSTSHRVVGTTLSVRGIAYFHLLTSAFGTVATRDVTGTPVERIRLLRANGLMLADIRPAGELYGPGRPAGRRQVRPHAPASEAGRSGPKGSCFEWPLVQASGRVGGGNGPVRGYVLAGSQADRTECAPQLTTVIGFV